MFSPSSESAAASSLQIHLDLGGLGERLRHLDGPQAARGGDVAFLQPRGEEIAVEVAQEGTAHARPDHLDGDLDGSAVALDLGSVDLRDRGGGDRFAEAQEKFADRPAERTFDGRDGIGHRKGFHAVLQQRQIERDVVADHVGTGGEELAELDIGRAEPCDRRRKPVATAFAQSPALGEEPRDPPAELRQPA